ncbi:class I SAM-dependent RNA methyltransferase [Candidatus Peregrinibacteria bacterium]|nr:class I SAM-dependent RNA methyltransferase [Candidatus Peregrinibacteria bacterium]
MRTPFCPHFGLCGGCATQHLPYEVQLENKKIRLIQEIGYKNVQVFSGDEFGYRNRMDFIFHPSGLGNREKGKWWRWVDIEKCLISNDRLNEIIAEIRRFFGTEIDAFDLKNHGGTFRYAVIRTPQKDSSVSFVLNKASSRLDAAIEQVKRFAAQSDVKNVLITYMPPDSDRSVGEEFFVVKGSDTLEETFLGKTFRYSAQGFFQNNSPMAEKMHEYVNGLLLKYDTKYAHLLDLYGGVGTFGIINSGLFKSVTTLESFEGCTLAAKENIKLNNAANVEAVCLDAAQLKKLDFPKPLYVVNDPPRSGMHAKTIKRLNELAPHVIIYISCNVKQLGLELKKFKDYKIRSAAIFDLFPQTNHMESVIELIRSAPPSEK